MLCFVCLRFSENIFAISGDNSGEYDISQLIEKHLSLKPPTEQEKPCMICEECWSKLKEFHDYYQHVAEVHNANVRIFEEIAGVRKESKCEGSPNGEIDIKEESIDYILQTDIEEVNFVETEDQTQNSLVEEVITEGSVKNEISSDFDVFIGLRSKGQTLSRITRRGKPKKPKSLENEETLKVKNKKVLPNRSKRKLELSQVGERNPLLVDVISDTGEVSPSNATKLRDCAAKLTKRRNGHSLLQENQNLITKHIKMSCEVCTDTSADFQSLITHFKLYHPDVKPHIKCCERKLDCPSDILQHAYYHEDPDYFKCEECGKRFINKSGLRDHYLQKHEPEENLPYACDQCPRRFSRRNLLEHHHAKHIPKTERSYFCEICKPTRAFANEYILQIHIKSRHTKAANICHVCAKQIRDKQAFEKHVRLHFEASGPRIKCPREGCDSWLKDKDNLKQHLRRFHDPQQYECPQCGRLCKNKNSLSGHLKTTHAKKTYNCEECQKSFKSQQSLKEHMAGHTGEALYSCPFCARTFNSKANMYSHKKKAHPIEWELWHQTKRGSKKEDL